MTALVTGAAGFIGFHLVSRMLELGETVIGFDGFTPYYDVKLKRDRAAILQANERFTLIEANLEDAEGVNDVLETYAPATVFHLAAQAGVRYSIDNPAAYINSNLVGTYNLLEAMRKTPPSHFMFASTSSIYGSNTAQPFREVDRTDFPVSLYAATKRSCEAMTHSYAHLYDITTTCFRFFTVYGPWGRPDMALFKFVDRIRRGEPIEVYGNGNMFRDFTYVDDLIEAMLRLEATPPIAALKVSDLDSVSPTGPWRVVNLAGGAPRSLGSFIEAIESRLSCVAVRKMLPMQAGDVVSTSADPSLLNELVSYVPSTPLEHGVDEFVTWYESYFDSL